MMLALGPPGLHLGSGGPLHCGPSAMPRTIKASPSEGAEDEAPGDLPDRSTAGRKGPRAEKPFPVLPGAFGVCLDGGQQYCYPTFERSWVLHLPRPPQMPGGIGSLLGTGPTYT